MAANRSTFEKLQRDRLKKERKEIKQARRRGEEPPGSATQTTRTAPPVSTDGPIDLTNGTSPIPPHKLIALVERLSEDHQAGRIDDEAFEEQRMALIARLPQD